MNRILNIVNFLGILFVAWLCTRQGTVNSCFCRTIC